MSNNVVCKISNNISSEPIRLDIKRTQAVYLYSAAYVPSCSQLSWHSSTDPESSGKPRCARKGRAWAFLGVGFFFLVLEQVLNNRPESISQQRPSEPLAAKFPLRAFCRVMEVEVFPGCPSKTHSTRGFSELLRVHPPDKSLSNKPPVQMNYLAA